MAIYSKNGRTLYGKSIVCRIISLTVSTCLALCPLYVHAADANANYTALAEERKELPIQTDSYNPLCQKYRRKALSRINNQDADGFNSN